MNRCLPLVLSSLIVTACHRTADLEKEKQSVMQTDRDFAALSVQAGAAEAFKQYSMEDLVLLPPNAEPVHGRDNVSRGFVEFDKSLILNWEPRAAEVAASGDLAYSWGTSTGTRRETGAQAFRGKYLTVWKKDANGNWKMIADMGNESPAPSQ
jgi:ketosteroid isomerase-like protein